MFSVTGARAANVFAITGLVKVTISTGTTKLTAQVLPRSSEFTGAGDTYSITCAGHVEEHRSAT